MFFRLTAITSLSERKKKLLLVIIHFILCDIHVLATLHVLSFGFCSFMSIVPIPMSNCPLSPFLLIISGWHQLLNQLLLFSFFFVFVLSFGISMKKCKFEILLQNQFLWHWAEWKGKSRMEGTSCQIPQPNFAFCLEFFGAR